MSELGLNSRDRQALALIEEALAHADPRFAAKLSAFSGLANGEPMPERERIRAERLQAVSRVARPRARRPRARRLGGRDQLISWLAVAAWVSITLVLISVALVIGNTGTKAACREWQAGLCVARTAPSAPAVPSGQGGHVPSSAP